MSDLEPQFSATLQAPHSRLSSSIPLPFALRRLYVSLRRVLYEELDGVMVQVKTSILNMVGRVLRKASAFILFCASTVLLLFCLGLVLSETLPDTHRNSIPLWEVLFTLGSIAAVGAFFIRGAPSSRGRDSYLKSVPLLPTASGKILPSSEEAGGEVESRLEGAREILASRASIVGEKIRDIVSIGAIVNIVSEPLVLAIAGYGLRVVLKMFRAHPITMVVGSCGLVFFLSRRGHAETLRGIGTRTLGRVLPGFPSGPDSPRCGVHEV